LEFTFTEGILPPERFFMCFSKLHEASIESGIVNTHLLSLWKAGHLYWLVEDDCVSSSICVNRDFVIAALSADAPIAHQFLDVATVLVENSKFTSNVLAVLTDDKACEVWARLNAIIEVESNYRHLQANPREEVYGDLLHRIHSYASSLLPLVSNNVDHIIRVTTFSLKCTLPWALTHMKMSFRALAEDAIDDARRLQASILRSLKLLVDTSNLAIRFPQNHSSTWKDCLRSTEISLPSTNGLSLLAGEALMHLLRDIIQETKHSPNMQEFLRKFILLSFLFSAYRLLILTNPYVFSCL
jgi:hypothetical protein